MTEPSHSYKNVAPVSPVAPYVGGKRLLANRLIGRIEAVPHELYAEPFIGMGGVFLRRRQAPKAEVINDLSRDVFLLFRVIQEHYPYFMDYLRFRVTSRAEFNRLVDTDPATLTDIQRAARFLYLQKTAFGAKLSGRNFGVQIGPARFNVNRIGQLLEDLHERLASVVIENLPFADFIRRYDRPSTLFYLDPPYWGCEDYYSAPFGRQDFEVLADLLGSIKGRFLMSLNDTPGVREVFKAFEIESIETAYTVSKGKAKPVSEIIISNAASSC